MVLESILTSVHNLTSWKITGIEKVNAYQNPYIQDNFIKKKCEEVLFVFEKKIAFSINKSNHQEFVLNETIFL